ncbi:MAG: histidinol-phosphate transaminase [Terrimesophilobacter sp.]
MASLTDLPLRGDLRGLSPYGAPQKNVRVALNVNENTHPLPQAVIDDVLAALHDAVQNANRYPDREFRELREALAGYLGHGLGEDNLWAANGSNEILQQILQAFGGPGRRVLGFPPTYSMYPLLARATGTEWVAGARGENFDLTPECVVGQVGNIDPDLVFFCSPNNPTGTPLSLDTIAAAYDATDGIVVVDEAYAEFAPPGTTSALTLLPGRERLIVSRTMSKAFGFAGVRLGYLAADPVVSDALRLVRLPYHLSALTQAAAIAALANSGPLLDTVQQIIVQRDRIMTELPRLGFPVWPSWTNFVLFGGLESPAAVFEELLARDILIRDVGIAGHLRVTAGTEEETSEFLTAMAELSRQ